MKIGVLETGGPPDPLKSRFGSYPEMFRALLQPAGPWRAYDVRAGDWPARPEDQDAYIVTGSACGVYDPEPWIGRLLDFLREARGGPRLIGVCFGHQAMAEAFGGKVVKSPKGWAIGLHRYQVRARQAWMDDAPSFAAPASHQDQVVELPPGAEVLAGSEFTPFGMLAWPSDRAFSVQLHPEFEPAYAAALIENRRGTRYTDAQADAAIASLSEPNDRHRLADWCNAFLRLA